MLVNGVWKDKWQPVQSKDDDGRFIRQTSSFRHQITASNLNKGPGGEVFLAEAGRYHLYLAYICPWASRVLMARSLKGLENAISVSFVNPLLSDQGWRFGGYDGSQIDEINHAEYLHQIYTQVDPNFTGRATVPVLWDKKTQTIVNNESADILRMLNTAFSAIVDVGPDLYPDALAADIDVLNAQLYTELNNAVYQAGFASTQAAYEEAYGKVFTMLDFLEARLSDQRDYLFGDQLTESDIRLFVTLVRFDAAYHGLFKCNRNTLKSMSYLHAYMLRILHLDGIAATVNMDHIKAGYYSIKALNPTGIVPKGPQML